MAAISVRKLCKAFPPRKRGGTPTEAVAEISLDVEPGERLAYIGPNGAGKSTSIKMLTGILYPTSGEASVLGITPWTERRRLAKRIGTLFGQRSQLWFQLSSKQAFALLARIYGLSKIEERDRVGELGELLDATELFDIPVRHLSLGQRMRCELVATMLHNPEILFLDEPSIGLDLVAKTRFRELVIKVNQERNTTIFLTSHDVADIEHVARRVIVINHGQLVYDDTVSRMRRSLLSTKVIDVRFEEPVESLTVRGAHVTKVTGSGAKLTVDTAEYPIRDVLDDLLDRFQVVDISVSDPPLEDLVSHIYEQPL